MKIIISFFFITFFSLLFAQREKPKNYRKFDERVFHFGFMLGGNVSDFTAFPQIDAYSEYGLKGMEVKSQPGGQLGILTSMKLGTPVVRLRFIPTLSFQERAIIQRFENPLDPENDIFNEERVNSTNLDFPLMFQFRTLRLNNFASYLLAGGQYSLDLQSQQDASQSFIDPFIKMKRNDFQGQVGLGVEFFAMYFKFGMKVKYSRSFNSGFIQDNTPSSDPINRLYNNVWWFSIIFEG